MSRNTPWRTVRKQYALHQPGMNDWYRFKNQANGPTQLHIYNEIGFFGVNANDFVRDLADVDGALEVHISSPGGEVFDGIAIYNALMARRGGVTVMIDSIAASIASVIAMAGNPVLIARQGTMMIHDGFAQAIGNAQDLRDLAEQLDRKSNDIAQIYSEHTGKPIAYWRELMKAETWLNAQECIDIGLADRFIDSGAGRQISPVQDEWDMAAAFGLPRSLKDAATIPYVGVTQTRHEPMTGSHNHDHAAYEHASHDDGIHAHKHSHSGDADHHHVHTAGELGNTMPGDDGATLHGHSHAVILASSFPEAVFYDRTFTEEQRKEMAADGRALPDGSYPIDNCKDADNARQAYGRAPEGKRSEVASHIRKRESALKCGTEPFKPGSANSLSGEWTDEDALSIISALRGA